MTSVLDNDLFQSVDVRIRFRDKILGGIPKQGSPLDYYITQSQMSDADAADFRARIKAGELTDEEKDAIKETNWCCFESDSAGHLCIWHGNIKSMLKEAFVALNLTKKLTKKGNLWKDSVKTHGLQVGVHVEPLRPLFVNVDGKNRCDPDGAMDKVKHVDGKFGEKVSALGRHDYFECADLAFSLRWLDDGPFDIDDITKAMTLCQDIGLGASRSQGHGKFDVVAFDVVDRKRKVIVEE